MPKCFSNVDCNQLQARYRNSKKLQCTKSASIDREKKRNLMSRVNSLKTDSPVGQTPIQSGHQQLAGSVRILFVYL